MIVTVTPNPALDLTWHVDRLETGETHRADAGVSRAGGKGLNWRASPQRTRQFWP